MTLCCVLPRIKITFSCTISLNTFLFAKVFFFLGVSEDGKSVGCPHFKKLLLLSYQTWGYCGFDSFSFEQNSATETKTSPSIFSQLHSPTIKNKINFSFCTSKVFFFFFCLFVVGFLRSLTCLMSPQSAINVYGWTWISFRERKAKLKS